jgi:hypothetical protein
MEPEEGRPDMRMVLFAMLCASAALACDGAPEQGQATEGMQGMAAAEAPGEAAAPGEEQEMPEGYVQLLRRPDGRFSKAGWNHYGPGHFELDPATGVMTSRGGMGLFWYSVREYGDFVLDLEYRCADVHTNSGVFVRVPGVPTSDDYIYHSFEIQINDAGEGIHQTGAVYDAEAPTHLPSNPPGEWNRMRITLVGSRIEVEINGEKVLEWEAEPRGKVVSFAQRGYIGLQNHDDRSPVYFRNIFVKDLEG